jgi:hypothetical protein
MNRRATPIAGTASTVAVGPSIKRIDGTQSLAENSMKRSANRYLIAHTEPPVGDSEGLIAPAATESSKKCKRKIGVKVPI